MTDTTTADELITVRVPITFRPLIGGAKTVDIAGSTVGEVLDNLEDQYSGFKERLLDESGAVHRYVSVFVGGINIRNLDGLMTQVPPGSEISIIPPTAGG